MLDQNRSWKAESRMLSRSLEAKISPRYNAARTLPVTLCTAPCYERIGKLSGVVQLGFIPERALHLSFQR